MLFGSSSPEYADASSRSLKQFWSTLEQFFVLNPVLQKHMKDPGMFLHSVFSPHGSATHSSTSEKNMLAP